LVWEKVLGSQKKTRNHAQSCGDKEKMLERRHTWYRQVGGGQGYLLRVVAPKKHLRQLSNLGWRATKGQKNNN